jgi:hypothetical protein
LAALERRPPAMGLGRSLASDPPRAAAKPMGLSTRIVL